MEQNYYSPWSELSYANSHRDHGVAVSAQAKFEMLQSDLVNKKYFFIIKIIIRAEKHLLKPL